MDNLSKYVLSVAENARKAALLLMKANTGIKNSAIKAMINLIDTQRDKIKSENKKDMDSGTQNGLSKAMIDRLELNDQRIDGIITSLEELIELPDPIGKTIKKWRRPNGMDIEKIKVPIGVIGIIYESRPNVTVDAASLCLKTGNATILRGGKEAFYSNMALTKILQDALRQTGLPSASIQLIETTDRAAVGEMLKLNEHIDLIIPRGGEGLIRRVVRESTIPVIKHYKGVCHLYADAQLDMDQAVSIIINSKVQRPGVCNALETLLVNENIANTFIPKICDALAKENVEIRGDEKVCHLFKNAVPATEEDWYTEYLDLILSIKIVKNVDHALEHIEKYGSRHSDGILTTNNETAKYFLAGVDSAAVYHNVSTRFTDGGQFGMGAEIGVSTDKLHARGPMGLEELTSFKFIVTGNGQIRN